MYLYLFSTDDVSEIHFNVFYPAPVTGLGLA